MSLVKQGIFKEYRHKYEKIITDYKELIHNYDGLYGDFPENNRDMTDIYDFIISASDEYHKEKEFANVIRDLLETTEFKTESSKKDFEDMKKNLNDVADDLVEKARHMVSWLGDDLTKSERNTIDEYRFW